jgi:hypothetical protein
LLKSVRPNLLRTKKRHNPPLRVAASNSTLFTLG